MDFSVNYFSRYPHSTPFFNDVPPNLATGIIVVIPCYDDEYIFQTLQSLENTTKNQSVVEVIVVVNSGINTPESIIKKNREIFALLDKQREKKQYSRFNLLPFIIENTPKRQAGVGHARKTGMDEAIRRFASINRPQGIIASLDADCLVYKDYFILLEKAFCENPHQGAFTLQFKHDFNPDIYSSEEINACKLYEMYLRYFKLALAHTGYPHCFHTIGSCLAVNATSYIKSGGMPSRQGGEDFYFLHKLAQLTDIGTINEVLVYPSPRISDRVPFGTGPMVKQIIHSGSYKIYNLELFSILKTFFNLHEDFFHSKEINTKSVPKQITCFIGEKELMRIITECKSNTREKHSFKKRFFSHFNALFIVKFLNSFDEHSDFPSTDVLDAIKNIFHLYNLEERNYSLHDACDMLLELDLKNP